MYTEKISNGESEVQQVSPTSCLPAAAQWQADESAGFVLQRELAITVLSGFIVAVFLTYGT